MKKLIYVSVCMISLTLILAEQSHGYSLQVPKVMDSVSDDPSLNLSDINKKQYFKEIESILRSPKGWTIQKEVMINKKYPEIIQQSLDTIDSKQPNKNQKDINVLDFGAKGDGITDDTLAINNTILAAQDAGGGIVKIPEGTYRTTSQITIKPNVIVMGAGRGKTIVRLSTYDQVFILENHASLKDLTADANNTNNGQTSKLGVIGIIGNYCIVDTVEVIRGYTGLVVTAGSHNLIRNIHSHDNRSRGVQLDPFAHDNIVTGVYSHNNGNAGIIIGHGSYNNIVTNFLLEHIPNGSLWLSQGVYKNKVFNGVIRDPLGDKVAINIQAGSYSNIISNIGVFNHPRVAQIIGLKVDGVYPEVVNNDSYGNILENIYAVGTSTTNSDNYAIRFQDADGSYTARDSEIKNSYFENFYGIFQNVSDAANNTKLRNIQIKTKAVGDGGIMKGMKSNGKDFIKISQVEGFFNNKKVEKTLSTNTLP